MINDYSRKWRAFMGIAILSFGCYLDYTVVNVALPTIQKELQVNLTHLQWIMNIYFLALCILATIMGRFGDLYGRRRVFYIGVNIFAIASLIAGLSTHIEWLIFGRLLQGVGAAMVFPLGPSLLPEAFPEKEREKAIAWLGSLGGVALALGPMLGGVIVTYWGWRWIFFINIPIILFGYLFSFKLIKESAGKHLTRELDWLGMLFLAFTMAGIVMSLIHSQTSGWLTVLTLTCLFIGIISSFLLFIVECNHPNPLIDFRDFSKLIFYAGAVLCFFAGVLSAVALFFDPLYLQIIKKQSPEFSGLVLFAIPITVFVVAFMVGGMIPRLGIIRTIICGLVLAMLACFLQVFFTTITPLWYIVITFICLGGMWAMGNTVTLIAAQTAAGPNRSSAAMGTMVTLFNIGGSIGITIAVLVYHAFSFSYLNHLVKMHTQLLSSDQFLKLEALLSNPAQLLKTQSDPFIYAIFNNVFMRGFSSVMWFLFGLSVLILLSVLIFNFLRKTNRIS